MHTVVWRRRTQTTQSSAALEQILKEDNNDTGSDFWEGEEEEDKACAELHQDLWQKITRHKFKEGHTQDEDRT